MCVDGLCELLPLRGVNVSSNHKLNIKGSNTTLVLHPEVYFLLTQMFAGLPVKTLFVLGFFF